MKIDNFALSVFQTCPLKYRTQIVEGWRPRRTSGALNAGLVLHKGIETWYTTEGSRDVRLMAALEAIRAAWPVEFPVDDYRNLEKVLKTMLEYTRQYPTENFKLLDGMVEVSFTLETGMFLDICPSCTHSYNSDPRDPKCSGCGADREPIEYGGIFDLMVEQSGSLYVVDHKTTSQMGPKYFYQFKPNNQMTGYIWGARQLSGRKVGGAIINAIGWYKSTATKFERQVTTRTDEDITNWLENVRQVCNLIKRAETLGEYPASTGACTLYGLCEFHRVHELPNAKEQTKMLEMYYQIQRWDHEARDEEATTTNG